MKKPIILLLIFFANVCMIFSQQTVVSEDEIPVNWSNREASSIKDEVMQEVFSHLSRYEYYFIDFGLHSNSATNSWRNRILFQTRQNPSAVRIQLDFNYFYIQFSFSNTQLSRNGVDFSESWFWGFVAQNQFRRELNDVLNRASLRMRGMNFGNNALYEIDRRWLEALRLPMI